MWLPQAIACYRNQSYPRAKRELLIVADGEDVRDLLPSDDDSIRLIVLDLPYGYSIGAKRNYGCSRARGEIVAHWDDDDYSAPFRLVDQAWRLQESGKSVTGYSAMRFTDGQAWWQYSGSVLGTSLCYRKTWWDTHPFAAVQVGEDNAFAAQARALGELVAPAGDPELMYATVHGNNTSPRSLSGSSWTRIA